MMRVVLKNDFSEKIKITGGGDPGHPPSFVYRPILRQFSQEPIYFAMKIMLFLILVSLTIAAGFLLAFLFAARNGQFDDDCTPAIRMLFDETTPKDVIQDED